MAKRISIRVGLHLARKLFSQCCRFCPSFSVLSLPVDICGRYTKYRPEHQGRGDDTSLRGEDTPAYHHSAHNAVYALVSIVCEYEVGLDLVVIACFPCIERRWCQGVDHHSSLIPPHPSSSHPIRIAFIFRDYQSCTVYPLYYCVITV